MWCILPGRIGCAACIGNAMRLRTISHGCFPPGGVVGKRCESNYAPATLRMCANVESRWKRPRAGDAEYEKQICTGTMCALFQDRRTWGGFEIALMHTPLLLQCDIFTRFCLHMLPPTSDAMYILRYEESFTTRRSTSRCRWCTGQHPRGTSCIFWSVFKQGSNVCHFTHSLISFSAFSTESEPWQMLRPTARA